MAGVITAPASYFQGLRTLCDERGAKLYVADGNSDSVSVIDTIVLLNELLMCATP